MNRQVTTVLPKLQRTLDISQIPSKRVIAVGRVTVDHDGIEAAGLRAGSTNMPGNVTV